MTTRLARVSERLSKLLLMLSASAPGEVASAARAIDSTLRNAGLDWHDLAARLCSQQQQESDDWRTLRNFCLRQGHRLRQREHEFLASLAGWRGDLTEKQVAWLQAIADRLRQPS